MTERSTEQRTTRPGPARKPAETPARPPLAELDAEREAIAATARLAEAQASVQTAAWRLRLLCGIE